jgi:hypothetical protein
LINSYSNGYPTGAAESVGAGTSDSAHIATPTTKYAGAYFEWTTNVNSGVAMTNIFIANNTSASAGGTGYANNRLGMSLVDPTPNTTPLTSALTITCKYKYSNGMIIGSKSYPFTHKTTNIVQTPPSTPPPQKRVGEGGCVAVDSWMDFSTQAGAAAVGEYYRTVVPGTEIRMMPIVSIEPSFMTEGVRIVTESGAALRISAITRFNLHNALSDLDPETSKEAKNMLGELVLVEHQNEGSRWEKVVSVENVGIIEVVPISFGGRSFAAGEDPGAKIFSHNLKFQGPEFQI